MEVIGIIDKENIEVKIIKHIQKEVKIGGTFNVRPERFRKIDEPLVKWGTMAMNDKQPIYWENTENGCSKFWAAKIIENPIKKTYALIRKWGKIGNQPQTLEQEFDDKSKAQEALRKLIWQKEQKGYKPIF